MRSLVAVAIVIALALGGAAWVFSDEIRTGVLELSEFRPTYVVEVVDVSAREITLSQRHFGETRLDRDERVGIAWEDGYGQALGYDGRTEGRVRREFRSLRGGLPDTGERVAIDEYLWEGDPGDLGRDFTEVMIDGELGQMPAWVIPSGDNAPWVVLVHGRQTRGRVEMLRLVPFLHEAGYNVMVPTYRNDEGAPQVEARRVGFGVSEWKELQAAMQWIEGQGGQDVSVIGYSMGAAITLSWMTNAPEEAGRLLRGVVLDSPATNIERTIELNAMQQDLFPISIPYYEVKVPRALASVAVFFAELRFDFDFFDADYVEKADQLPDVPILVLHGTEDTTIPIETSRAFSDAAIRARLVEMFGGHTRLWNVDPEAYEGEVLRFLGRYGP